MLVSRHVHVVALRKLSSPLSVKLFLLLRTFLPLQVRSRSSRLHFECGKEKGLEICVKTVRPLQFLFT